MNLPLGAEFIRSAQLPLNSRRRSAATDGGCELAWREGFVKIVDVAEILEPILFVSAHETRLNEGVDHRAEIPGSLHPPVGEHGRREEPVLADREVAQSETQLLPRDVSTSERLVRVHRLRRMHALHRVLETLLQKLIRLKRIGSTGEKKFMELSAVEWHGEFADPIGARSEFPAREQVLFLNTRNCCALFTRSRVRTLHSLPFKD